MELVLSAAESRIHRCSRWKILIVVGKAAIIRQRTRGAIRKFYGSICDTARKCGMNGGKKTRGRGQSGLDRRPGVGLLVKFYAPDRVGIHVEARRAQGI